MHLASRARSALAIFALLLVAGCFLDPAPEDSTVPPGDTSPPPPLASPGLLEDITGLGTLYTPADNWWNLEVTDAPIDPNSASIIATVKGYESTGGRLQPEFTPDNGIPYAVVGANTPLVPVTFANTEESDAGAPGQTPGYPIPTAANVNSRYLEDAGNSGSNRHLLLLDRDRRLAFELSYAQYSGGKWSAGYGAVFKLDSNYRRPDGWTSTDPAGLCVLAGLARYDEVYGSDPIRHALRCSLQKTNGHVWPASHTGASDAGAPPLGTRFRLKASFDTSDYPAPMRKVLQAMKTYGLIVTNRGGNMYCQGTMDSRWDNNTLDPAFHSLHVDDFDVIKLGWDGSPTPPPPTPPAAPTPSSPANGATNVAVPVTLSWNASSGATSYTAQVSSSSSFSSFAYNQSGITSTSRSVSGLSDNTVYYWRVSATNAGGTSSFSATSSFTTEDVTPPPPPPPAVPTLSAPANGATGVAVPVTLSWNASSGATSYTAQVSSSSSFSSFAYNQSGITSTSRSVSGLSSNTVYYWRVSATNAGGTSSYSATSSFTTEDVTPPPPPPPAVPTLSSPANGATGVAVPVTMTWNASSGATSYTAQVSASSSFSSFAYNQSGITSTSRSVSGLSDNTVYYWRVSATNAGGTSSYSATSSFTTEDVTPPPPPPPPAVPTLSSPANGATGVAVPVTLSWNASSGATSYTAQVSASSSFSSFAYNQAGITSTSRSVSGLSDNTVYYWRVSATNAGGTSSYSATSSFTTEDVTPPPPPPPAVPTLSAPANGATGVAVPVTLTWNASSGATSYTAQVSASSSFSSFAYNQAGITSTSRSVSGLSDNTVYYWRVSATNAGGTSSFSATSSFTTEDVTPPPPPPPAVPTLSSPANGATGVAVPVTLTWNASSGATSYTAQVSTSSSFSSFAYNQAGITSTSRSVSGLSDNTVYYWRVSATNAGGTSSYSATSSFTTEDVTPPPPPPPPAVPTLSSPANGATGVAVPVTLSWNASSGATSYTAQVSSSSSFSSFAYNQSGITATSRSVSGLSDNTVYYWRVSATNAGGTSSFSATSSFTTEDLTPPPPPPPGQVGLGLLADLSPLGTLYAPADNWWNLDVSNAPLASNSAQIIATIQTYESTQGRMHPDFAPNFGIPYCVVDDNTPLVQVSIGNTSESDKGYPGAPTGYPIPAAAMTNSRYFENGATAGNSNGGDSHLLIYNRDKRAVFELSYCSYSGGKWSAGYGAIFKVDSNYRRPDGWTSTDAAGLCVLAGLVTYDEVYGPDPIRHATRTSIKKVNGYVWPASHTGSTDPNGFPCGMRFRLKKSFDTSGYPAPLRKLFESWKVYGLILSDRGGNMYIQGTMDNRWDNGVLNPAFHSLHASDFEVIQLGWKP